MKIFPFVLLAGALSLSHPAWTQTNSAQPLSPMGPSEAQEATGATPNGPVRKVTVANLTAKNLRAEDETKLGDIERVVERKEDKKSYIVVSRGGVLGFFGQLYLVPLDQIAVAGDRVVAKEMTQAQLESSAKFVEDTAVYREVESTQLVNVPEKR